MMRALPISDVPSQKINTMFASKAHRTFRVQRNPQLSAFSNIKSKDSKAFDDFRSGFELQTSDDGINFKKLDASTFKASKKTTPNNI
jgi:hypothetical protein